VVATSLVDADLRGIHSHGVVRLGIYVERLRRGGNDPRGEVSVIAGAPAFTLLDSGNVLGQIASARAVEIAIDQARKMGCAVVSVRSGSHFGAAGYWARLIAEAGGIGVASTNGSPIMVPFGSATSALGTNPIALAFPSSGLPPVVVGHLAERYGSRLTEVLEVVAREARLAEPIVADLPDRRAEVVTAVEREWALTLEDVLRRRTRVALEDAAGGTGVVEDVAALMAPRLGWTPEQARAAVARYVAAAADARRWQ